MPIDAPRLARLFLMFMAFPQSTFRFPVTQWTVVVQLSHEPDEAARRNALECLCRDYWYPLYAFARRLGHSQHDAEDLTQGYFAYLFEHNVLATASRELGKLRTFLLTVFQRYIGDEEDRQRAWKRGGRQVFVPLDLVEAEELYRHEPAGLATPETLYERTWALQVLRAAVETLRQSESNAGRGHVFELLAPFLDPDTAADARTDQAAQALAISPEGVRQAVGRLRRKFRLALRRQIAATLQDPGDPQIDEEMTALQAALRV